MGAVHCFEKLKTFSIWLLLLLVVLAPQDGCCHRKSWHPVKKQINDIPVHQLLQLLDPDTYRRLEQQIALNWFSYNLFRSMRPGFVAFAPEIADSTEPHSFEEGGYEPDHKPTCNHRNKCKCSTANNKNKSNKPKLIQSTIDEYFKPESAREINREIKITSPPDWPSHYYRTVGKNASQPTAGDGSSHQASSEELLGGRRFTATMPSTTAAPTTTRGCKKHPKTLPDHRKDDVEKWVKLYQKDDATGVPEVKKIVFVDRKSLLEME